MCDRGSRSCVVALFAFLALSSALVPSSPCAAQDVPEPPRGDAERVEPDSVEPDRVEPTDRDLAEVPAVVPGHAPPFLPEVDGRAALLDAWLETRASADHTLSILGGIGAILAGGASVVVGGWVLATEAFTTAPYMNLVLSMVPLAFGAMAIGMGIYRLAVPPPTVDRLARWRRAVEAGAVTPELIASFEGELRADAARAEAERWSAFAMAIGVSLSGVAMIIMTAATSSLSSEEALFGYGVGGAYAGAFALMAVLTALVTSPSETDWERYARGEGPHARLAIQPVLGLGFAGLTGAF